jgi:cytoskeleton protein RodZ
MGKIGEALRKAREAKSITLRQAEEATKIRLKYLEALEREDYSQIPGRVYAIGFLRNYARYLGLDWQPLVEELKAALPPEEEEEYKISPSPSEESQDRPKKGLWRWFTVLLVVLFLWGLNQLYNRARPTPDTNLSLSPPAAENRGESPPQGQVSPPSPVPPSPLPPPISGVEVKVYIKEKECWIGVKIDGKDSFSGLLKAGETKTFHGDKEITLTLGSAGVAEVTVNNQVLPPLGRVGEVVTKTFTGSSTP